ncbi:MAG: YajD family HNH nuclease [Dehalococcoidia bacterium]|jgi:GNAT superfamily N-acetyltransferase
MTPAKSNPDKMNKLVAQVRHEREQWDQSYRGQALNILPHICSHCGREFSGRRLKELTVHHKDNDHLNNPPDGSNWELLCIYCHDNEHTRMLQSHRGGLQLSGSGQSRTTYKPFENLKALLGDEETKVEETKDEEPADIAYRAMKQGEEDDVCTLVTRVFKEFVAPQYTFGGIEEFLKFADPEAMAARTQANDLVLVAETNDDIVGVIEMRDGEHICLLFVDKRFHRQGIARELLKRALEICARNRTGQATITVHSSPNAVEAYRHLGFQSTGPEQTKNGIRFVPMTLNIQ